MAPPPIVAAETIEKATTALLKWQSSKSKTQKPQLLGQDQDQFIYLVLTLKKIPSKSRTNPYKIPLPHPLHTPPNSELCLIVDDRPNSNLTSQVAKTKMRSETIPVSKVLSLSKLKSNFRPFEAKRKLCDSYDLFLADKRIVPLLPKLLGKHFFKKRKIPVAVDLGHKNWKEQIERVCGSALMFLRTGTCSVVRVGKISMEKEQIVENVVAAINGVVEMVPKKWAGVRSLHLKLLESLALPVYQAVPDMKLKIDGAEGKREDEEVKKEEESGKVEKKDKKKKKVGKKGRIHEVRYMDAEIGGLLDEDELDSDGEEDDGDGEKSTDYELGDDEHVGKKRKKGNALKEQGAVELNEKPLKKSKKVKKEDDLKQRKDKISLKAEEEDSGNTKKDRVHKLKNQKKVKGLKK